MTTITQIQRFIGKEFKITTRQLHGHSRRQCFVMPRHIAMWLCYELLHLPFETIGPEFGGRDHGTVRYAVQMVRDRKSVDARFNTLVSDILARVKGLVKA